PRPPGEPVAARPRFAAVLALALGTAGLVALAPQSAGAAGFAQATVPSAVPATYTPDVKNGVVYSIGQVGNTTILGGTFTSVAPHAGTGVAHKSIVAFNASTGALVSTFAPKLDGEVDAIIPGPVANSIYIAGTFTHVNGKAMHVGLIDATTGATISTWKPATMDSATTSLRVADGLLFVGGNFTTVGTSHLSGIVALNPTTGALSSYVNLNVAGHHGQGSQQGSVGVKAFDIDPSGQ